MDRFNQIVTDNPNSYQQLKFFISAINSFSLSARFLSDSSNFRSGTFVAASGKFKRGIMLRQWRN
jgi:hypothetical protein